MTERAVAMAIGAISRQRYLPNYGAYCSNHNGNSAHFGYLVAGRRLMDAILYRKMATILNMVTSPYYAN